MSLKDNYKNFAECLLNLAIEFKAIGLSYQDYWYGELQIADQHFEAYRRKQKYEMYDFNCKAWLQGQYFMLATAANLSDKVRYPEKPKELNLFHDEKYKGLTEQERIELDMIAYLTKK